MLGNDLTVTLDLDDGMFRVRLMRAGQEIRNFGQAAENAGRGVDKMGGSITSSLSRLRDVTVIAGQIRSALENIRVFTIDLAQHLADAAGRFQTLTALMKGFSVATSEAARNEEAKNSVDYIVNQARRLPFSIGAIQDSFVKFKSVGIDPTKGGLEGLANTIAKFGGTDESLQRASIAIQQMAGKGVISMEELRQQLGEAVPTAVRSMARALNMTIPELVKKISLGAVEASSALSKFNAQILMESQGAAAALMNTWAGAMRQLSTEYQLFLNKMANMDLEKGYGDAEGGPNSFIGLATQSLRELKDLLNNPEFIKAMTGILQGIVSIGKAIASVATFAGQHWDKIVAVAKFYALVKIIQIATGVLATFSATGVLRAIMGLGGLSRALGVAHAAILSMAFGLSGLSGATTAVTGAMARTTVVLSALGVAFRALLGPIGLALGVLYTLYTYFKSNREEAKRLEEQILQTKGAMASLADIKVLEENLAKATRQFQYLLREKAYLDKKAQEGINVKYDLRVDGETVQLGSDRFFQHLEDKRLQQLEAESALNLAIEGLRQREGNRFAERKLEEVELTLAAAGKKAESERLLQDQMQATQTKEQAAEAKKAIRDKLFAEQEMILLAALKAAQEESTAAVEADIEARKKYADIPENKRKDFDRKLMMKTATDAAAADSVVAKLGARLNDLRESKERLDQTMESPTILFGGDKTANNTLKSLESLLESVQERALKLRAQVSEPGDTGYYENISAQVRSLKGNLEGLSTSATMEAQKTANAIGAVADKILHWAEVNEQIETTRKFSKGMLDLTADVNKAAAALAGASQKVSELQSKFESGGFGNVERLTENQRKSFEFLAVTLDKLKQAGGYMKDATQGAESLDRATTQLNTESLVGRARIMAEFNQDVSRYKKILEDMNIADQIRQEAISQFQDTRMEREENFAARLADAKARGDTSEIAAIEREKAAQERIYQDLLASTESFNADKAAIHDKYNAYLAAANARLARDLMTPMQKINLEWQDWIHELQDTWVSWTDNAIDGILEWTETGKFAVKDMVNSMLKDLLRISLQKAVMGPLSSALSGLAQGFFQTMFPGPSGSPSATPTGFGAAATSGIIQSAQSLFGASAAAIPMSLNSISEKSAGFNSAGGTGSSVQFNVMNQSGTPVNAQQTGARVDGKTMMLDVVLTAMKTPGSFRDEMRGAIG